MGGDGIETYLADMAVDVNQWIAGEPMTRAVDLTARSGQAFSATTAPMFFTGDLEAEVVLIHLNPKLADLDSAEHEAVAARPGSFDEYVDQHRWFGSLHYGPDAPDGYRSRFDHDQIAFLRPFRLLPLGYGPVTRQDLVHVLDDKLQMELVPYASDQIGTSTLRAHLGPRIDLLLGAVAARPRRLVIFCGREFTGLLASRTVASVEHRFQPSKKDGTLAKSVKRVQQVTLSGPTGPIDALIASSFAARDGLKGAYGAGIAEIVGTGP